MSHNVAGSGERNKQPGLWNVAREQRLAPSNKFINKGPNQAALPTTNQSMSTFTSTFVFAQATIYCTYNFTVHLFW